MLGLNNGYIWLVIMWAFQNINDYVKIQNKKEVGIVAQGVKIYVI